MLAGDRFEGGFGLGGDAVRILDEPVDEIARHRIAESVGRIGEEIARIGLGVECLEMGAETAREPAGQLDRAVAGTAAACRGQNGLECHGTLLPGRISLYNAAPDHKVTPRGARGDEGEMSVIRKLIMAIVLCVFAALPAQAATKINFMYTAVASWVGLYVAKDQGMLAKHGLDIDMTLTTNGSLISAALVADTAQTRRPDADDTAAGE